ncbi:MAG: recombinase family protein [bacterium]
MAAGNKSLSEIGLELSRRGVKSPKGQEWRKQSISNIVKCSFYKGYVQYSGELYKGTHPAIVDENLWEKANKLVTGKIPGHRFIKKPTEYNYLLKGLLKCPKCKSHYISLSCVNRSKQRFFYYICGRSKQGLGCNMPEVSATVFDQALIQYFKKASNDQEILIKAIGNAILDAQTKLENLEKLIAEQEGHLEAAKKEAKRLLDLALHGTIPEGTTFKTKMAELDAEILKLEDTLGKLQAQKSVAQMNANSGQFLYSNIRFALKYLDQAPPDAQKSLIRALIKEIWVYEDRIELQMYINQPIEDTIPWNMPPVPQEGTINGKRLAENSEALTYLKPSSSGRQVWLLG